MQPRALCAKMVPGRGAWDWAILIEQALFLAIGFLAATLAAVAAAPLVSRRAMRLAVARSRLRAPVTQKQAIADADALRARHAVERARIERNLTLAEEVSAGLRVAVGRQAAEIIRLKSDIDYLKGELYDQCEKAEIFARQKRDLLATIDASQIFLEDAFIQRDRASAARIAAEARAADLGAESSRLRARVAVSTARAEYLEGRIEDLMAESQAARAEVQQTGAALAAQRNNAAALEQRVAAVTSENRSLAGQLSKAAAEHSSLAEGEAELEQRLRLSEKVREETLLENGRRLAELGDREAALALATAKGAGLESRLAALASEHHARENALSLRAETLASAHAAMEDSLRTAREEREALNRENESLRSRLAAVGDPAADSQLRQSIGRLGLEVARLFSAQKASDGKDIRVADREPPGVREVEHALFSAEGRTRRLGEGRVRRAGRSHEER